jgi:hypothetical protein
MNGRSTYGKKNIATFQSSPSDLWAGTPQRESPALSNVGCVDSCSRPKSRQHEMDDVSYHQISVLVASDRTLARKMFLRGEDGRDTVPGGGGGGRK